MGKSQFFELLDQLDPSKNFWLSYVPVVTIESPEYILRLMTKHDEYEIKRGKVSKVENHESQKQFLLSEYGALINEWQNRNH